MSAATIRINDGAAIALDPVRATKHTTQGVLLTLEGRANGVTLNCALIPLERVRAVIQGLELAEQLARAG